MRPGRRPGGQYPGAAGGEGISLAKHHSSLYVLASMVPTLMLFPGGYAGYKYLIVATSVSVWWLGMALSGYKPAVDDALWAHKLFIFSIVTITCLSAMMSVDAQPEAVPVLVSMLQ